MRKDSGFTLIELMIVIAILGLLIAIALPAYQDYSIRTKVSEGLLQAGAARLAVAETASSRGQLVTAVSDNVAAGFVFATNASPYVADVVITNGVITVTTRNTGAATSPVLTLTPTHVNVTTPATWTCSYSAGVPQHVPASCR